MEMAFYLLNRRPVQKGTLVRVVFSFVREERFELVLCRRVEVPTATPQHVAPSVDDVVTVSCLPDLYMIKPPKSLMANR